MDASGQVEQADEGRLERSVMALVPELKPAAWYVYVAEHQNGYAVLDEDDAQWVDDATNHGAQREPLYDLHTLWNAVARAGEVERAKLVDDTADALRFRWMCRYPDWHFIEHLCRHTTASTSTEFLDDLRRVIDARRSVALNAFEQHIPPEQQAP